MPPMAFSSMPESLFLLIPVWKSTGGKGSFFYGHGDGQTFGQEKGLLQNRLLGQQHFGSGLCCQGGAGTGGIPAAQLLPASLQILFKCQGNTPFQKKRPHTAVFSCRFVPLRNHCTRKPRGGKGKSLYKTSRRWARYSSRIAGTSPSPSKAHRTVMPAFSSWLFQLSGSSPAMSLTA